MILVRSDSLDPYRNLAIEEILLDCDRSEEPLLFLWQSADAVVIGKNQNPWQECNLAQMRECGVCLARRNTGGGAVYHDEGNLNFALFCARNTYCRDDVYDAVIRAVRRLGVAANRMGKSSLAVGDHKVSGSAFAYRRNVVLHHGTLLVCSDLSRFSVLRPPADVSVTTRAVRSEPAAVANLADLQPGIDVDAAAAALIESFAHTWGPAKDVRLGADLDTAALLSVAARLQSPAWLIGQGPDFSIHLKGTAASGEIGMCLNTENGRIAQIQVHGMDPDTERFLQNRLPGVTLTAKEIGAATADEDVSPALQDVIEWIVRAAA